MIVQGIEKQFMYANCEWGYNQTLPEISDLQSHSATIIKSRTYTSFCNFMNGSKYRFVARSRGAS